MTLNIVEISTAIKKLSLSLSHSRAQIFKLVRHDEKKKKKKKRKKRKKREKKKRRQKKDKEFQSHRWKIEKIITSSARGISVSTIARRFTIIFYP